jgi:hypothetical protein
MGKPTTSSQASAHLKPPLRKTSLAAQVPTPRSRSAARADDQVTEATGPHTRLMSMALAFVTGWLLVWGAVAGAGTFSYLRPS